MSNAIDVIKSQYLTQDELASLFGVTTERIRDLRSIHKSDGKFIEFYRPTANCILFHVVDVQEYIENSRVGIQSPVEKSQETIQNFERHKDRTDFYEASDADEPS